jgi:hypothetical protein
MLILAVCFNIFGIFIIVMGLIPLNSALLKNYNDYTQFVQINKEYELKNF